MRLEPQPGSPAAKLTCPQVPPAWPGIGQGSNAADYRTPAKLSCKAWGGRARIRGCPSLEVPLNISRLESPLGFVSQSPRTGGGALPEQLYPGYSSPSGRWSNEIRASPLGPRGPQTTRPEPEHLWPHPAALRSPSSDPQLMV